MTGEQFLLNFYNSYNELLGQRTNLKI